MFHYHEALDANSISALYANGGPLLPSHHPGDTNDDGVVDPTDLNNVLNNFGSTHPASPLSTVPEPASSLACFFAAHPVLARRRRA